jgi:PPOX class probable F420-dependent enzyme
MIRSPKLSGPTTTAGQARDVLRDEHVHAVLIVDGGRLLAVVERPDLEGVPADLPAPAAGSLRNRVVTPDTELEAAWRSMAESGRRRLAVIDEDGTLLGLLCLKRTGRGFCSDADIRARSADRVQGMAGEIVGLASEVDTAVTVVTTEQGASMSKPPLPEHFAEILKRPNPAVMATVRPDGAPVSVATWYLWEDGRVLLNLDAGRKRLEHLRADPRVSLTVLDKDSWYRHVSLRGTVTLKPDPDLAGIDRLSRHYTGEPYPNRTRPRVDAWLDIAEYHAWGWDQ